MKPFASIILSEADGVFKASYVSQRTRDMLVVSAASLSTLFLDLREGILEHEKNVKHGKMISATGRNSLGYLNADPEAWAAQQIETRRLNQENNS